MKKPRQLIVDLKSVKQPAQSYVMLSRVQELTQLFILGKRNFFSNGRFWIDTYHAKQEFQEWN